MSSFVLPKKEILINWNMVDFDRCLTVYIDMTTYIELFGIFISINECPY